MYCLLCDGKYVSYFNLDWSGCVLQYTDHPMDAIIFDDKGDGFLFIVFLQTLGYCVDAFSVVEVEE